VRFSHPPQFGFSTANTSGTNTGSMLISALDLLDRRALKPLIQGQLKPRITMVQAAVIGRKYHPGEVAFDGGFINQLDVLHLLRQSIFFIAIRDHIYSNFSESTNQTICKEEL
jgi:hypothetical protein